MLLLDIGNTYAHLFDGNSVQKFDINELLNKYSNKKLYYINVNPKVSSVIKENPKWIDLSKYVKLDGAYEGMGIDRQVLCLSYERGIFIDAGSAITIDKVIDGKFIGGTILPGLWSLKRCYQDISSKLIIDHINDIDLNSLPNSNTKDSISYGIIAPIIFLIEKINKENLPIYFSGGDGKVLKRYFKDAIYDELLIFKSMANIVRRIKC